MSEYTTREILDMIEANGGPEGLDLSGQDLSGIDLSRQTIQAELDAVREKDRGAEPLWWSEGSTATYLVDASLGEPDAWAALVGRTVEQPELGGVNLRGAYLDGAIMWKANLRGADLRNAELKRANLAGASLGEANLLSANLEEAFLQSAHLEGALVWGARVRKANLDAAHLQEVNLVSGDLQGTSLYDTQLEGAKLEGADLRGATVVRANLEGADLTGANVEGAHLVDAELEEARLVGANLRGACFSGACLERADLTDASLPRVDLRDAGNIKGICLYRAVLDKTQLTKDQLGGAVGEEVAGRWGAAMEAYLELKNNFEEIGRDDDASWAYCRERRMEKREAWQKAKEALKEGNWRRSATNAWKAGWDLVVEYLCDYGESVSRVLTWMGFLLFIAGPLLFGIPGVLKWPQENRNAFFSRQVTWRYAYAYVQHFLYVLDAFTTASFAELQPATALTRVLSGLTAVVGVFLTGLLGFVAGNRIRRS